MKLAIAVAVAADEFVCVMSGVSWAGAASTAGEAAALGRFAGEPASGLLAAGNGSPLHVQAHTQLHEHAWSKLNELVMPLDRVHVQVQIQWPATGETETVGLAPAVAPAEACVASHDQTHALDPVGASAGVGIVPTVHTQVQTHGSLPVGTTMSPPGKTTDTLTLRSPLVVTLAEAAFASAVFACVGTSSCPGLPTRTEMFTFVGLLCAAVAV